MTFLQLLNWLTLTLRYNNRAHNEQKKPDSSPFCMDRARLRDQSSICPSLSLLEPNPANIFLVSYWLIRTFIMMPPFLYFTLIFLCLCLHIYKINIGVAGSWWHNYCTTTCCYVHVITKYNNKNKFNIQKVTWAHAHACVCLYVVMPHWKQMNKQQIEESEVSYFLSLYPST